MASSMSSRAPCSRPAAGGLLPAHGRIAAPIARPCRARRGGVAARSYADSLDSDCYMVVGLAHCFEKSQEGGKLQDLMILEPVNATSMECLAIGARTSYKTVAGVTYGTAVSRDKAALPAEMQAARYCENWEARCEAAARTWMRPHAQDNLMDLVPLGGTRSGFNFNLDDKRVMNMVNVVNDDDNVKQDMSIDVYGRKEKEDKAAAAAAAKKEAAVEKVKKQAEEEDELDKLLSL